jgi:hypothetical protein
MTTIPDHARVVALFVCDLQPSQHPARKQVRRAVARVLRQHSTRWCMARMAVEFSADPEASACRMAWALRLIRDCYGRPAPVRPTRCRATGRFLAAPHYTDPDPWPGYREAPRCPFTAARYRRSVP